MKGRKRNSLNRKSASRSVYAAILLSSMIMLSAGLSGCSPEDEFKWELTFEDEFEGTAGELPDISIWQFDIGTGWGNEQLECDTNRPENVSLDGYGHLAITAREEDYPPCDYTSGRITTRGTFAQDRGRFEARIKLPIGQGIWPAFWLLGSNIDDPGIDWPECGEIDIMEYRGQEPTVLHGSLHGPGYSGGDAISRKLDLGGNGLNEDYHIYSIEWTANQITWKFDGTAYLTVTPENLPSGTRWVFDHPFFIILNVAVGGFFVGSPDETTQFPQTMLVDWVRVYRGG